MEKLRGRWIHDAPGIEEIASDIAGRRGGRTDTALIILSSGDRKTLREHIEALKEQDERSFDVIIVYGKDDGFLEGGPPINIIHARERMPLGCAGAFYLGQRIAMREGYSRILLADDDAFPESRELVSKHILMLEKGFDIVLPGEASYGPMRKKGGIIHHYGGIRREVFEKAGLTFLPFYNGGEDLELLERFRQEGFRIGWARTRVSHPPFRPVYLQSAPKLFHYQRGMLEYRMIRSGILPTLRMMAYDLTVGVLLFTAGDALRSRAILGSLWSASGFRFFRDEGIGSKELEETEPSGIIIDRKDAPGANGAIASLSALPRCFNKKITLVDSPRYKAVGDLLLALFARRTCSSIDGKTYLVGAQRHTITILVGFALLLFAIPMIIAAAPLLACRGFIIKKLSGIETKGYGIGKKS